MENGSKITTTGGALIVAGTSIGAGMLGLPIVTGPAGFVPSIAVLLVGWAFMTITGLLFAELSVWLKKEVNLLSMAETTLGKFGKALTWGIYLFFFYCLLVAYLGEGGQLIGELYGHKMKETVRILLFCLIFVSVIVIGKRVVDPINKLFMFGLFAAYIGFVMIGARSITAENLIHQNWVEAQFALPIAFASFGFQGTVPTLSSWMGYDRKKIRKAIISGTLITFTIYLIWQTLLLGIIPVEGAEGLIETKNNGRDAVYPLQFFTSSAIVWTLGKVFAFCAIATSFIGVGIGIMDFLKDGFDLHKKSTFSTLIVVVLSFGVPLSFALSNPRIFLKALGIAGGFGAVLLLGLLPIVMVFRAKYHLKKPVATETILSNRIVLFLLALGLLFQMWTEFLTVIE